MKISLVVHYFLPRHQAGTEIYTYRLAKALQKSNHEISIFTSEDADMPPGKFELRMDELDRIKVSRVYRGEPDEFVATYRDEAIDEIFRGYLRKTDPDVVHFQHMYRLSAGMVNVAKEELKPTVITLADYWFLCPAIILLRPDFQLCAGPSQGMKCVECGNAIGGFFSGDISGTALGKKVLKAKAARAYHTVKRNLPRPMVNYIKELRQKRLMLSPESDLSQRRELLTDRFDFMIGALEAADLIISPSAFLKERFVDAGIDAERITVSDYGFEKNLFEQMKPKSESDTLRLGYIGTLVEHKGVHVLVEAMKKLKGENVTLDIWGDITAFPNYVRHLKSLAKGASVNFKGRFENDEVAEIYSNMDALVIPSIWWENSPLTIHEAFLARTPVIASNVGGMAELVKPGENGLLFKVEDSSELAKTIKELAGDRNMFKELDITPDSIKSIEENAMELEELYGIVAR